MLVLQTLSDSRLVSMLQQGAVGIIPTDTIYGLAASAVHKQAVAQLYALKSRDHKPGTIIAANTQQLVALGLSPADIARVEKLWPNPISIVLPAPTTLNYLDQEVGSLAVRIPKNPAVQALLEQTGPLVTSSANHPGEAPAGTVGAAQAYFGETVAFYAEGGDLSGRPASTVVRLEADGTLTTLRQGALTISKTGDVL